MEGSKSVSRMVHLQFTMTEIEADILAFMLQNPITEGESVIARKVRALVFNTIKRPAQPEDAEKT